MQLTLRTPDQFKNGDRIALNSGQFATITGPATMLGTDALVYDTDSGLRAFNLDTEHEVLVKQPQWNVTVPVKRSKSDDRFGDWLRDCDTDR